MPRHRPQRSRTWMGSSASRHHILYEEAGSPEGGNARGAMVMRSVAVFGGTGFLGRAVVGQLVAADVKVRVAVRHPEPIKRSDGTAR